MMATPPRLMGVDRAPACANGAGLPSASKSMAASLRSTTSLARSFASGVVRQVVDDLMGCDTTAASRVRIAGPGWSDGDYP